MRIVKKLIRVSKYYVTTSINEKRKPISKNDAARKLLTTQDSKTTTGIDPKVI